MGTDIKSEIHSEVLYTIAEIASLLKVNKIWYML